VFALLLGESASSPNEGWVHWFILHDGVTLATWVLAILALIPLLSRWNVIRSKKRDDQLRSLQWLDSQFNSAAIASARRETGKNMQKDNFLRDLSQFPYTSAWPIIDFLSALHSYGRKADWI
jgi:hypothetical protein